MPVMTGIQHPRALTGAGEPHPERAPDPELALYRQAAGLLATAQALEVAARAPGAVAALAPTLACLEATLSALAGASHHLGGQARQRLSTPVLLSSDARAQRDEVALRFDRLVGTLKQTRRACVQARTASAPVLTEPIDT